jgi:hypothetical protein
MPILSLPKNLKRSRPQRRAGTELAQTMSVVSQMALLCPSGMDVWMQRELAGCFELERPRAARR